MNTIVLESPADWAEEVRALAASGPLPARTVLVPSERHAHALRRALARSGATSALAGTRFLGPFTAAVETLRNAGVEFTPGEEGLRPARLAALFGGQIRLEHFDQGLLDTTRGWEEAFARSIGALEAAGLGPGDIPRDSAPARDLALVWSRLDAEAGASYTARRIYREAAAVLGGGGWPFGGPTLAALTGHEGAALARFVRAIPDVTVALWRARPLRKRHLARVEALFGKSAREALEAPPRPRAQAGDGAAGADDAGPSGAPALSERDILARFLFQPAVVLAAPERPRSRGPDGTVDLEEHAGVENELEAAAQWVARQVVEEGLPLEEIAVLVPAQDPLAQLVADRLERLPFEGGPLPVHVAGGVPAVAAAGGARILACIRALRAWLHAEALAGVLPALRLEGLAERAHLSHGEATELAFSLGTVGGNSAHPEGALEWSGRAEARLGELAAALERALLDEDSAAREARRLERTLGNLRAVRPALDDLVAVARAVVTGAPLAAVWGALGAFIERRLLLPGEGASLRARLEQSLAAACSSLGSDLGGARALDLVERHLLALRIPRGRFGAPAVYVGTVASAVGLGFSAVRVLGLCEGALPTSPREDPVVPEAARQALESAAPDRVLPHADDEVAAQVHALFAVVQGARKSIALSAPRFDLDRTEREPASFFVEAAAALARPNSLGGEPAPVVPDAAALRRDSFGPARRAADAFRTARPVSESAWLDRVARVAPELPPSWSGNPALALDRVDALRAPGRPLGTGDGGLGAGEPFPPVPGLGPELPISASGLEHLLRCPRSFLLRRILGWEEPAAAPLLREIDALSYGSLLHRAVEWFYREHGRDFVERRESLERWLEVAFATGDRLFDEFLSEYPLVGQGVRAKERRRLRESLRVFLEYDWNGSAARRFVGVELAFGVDAPLTLSANGRPLHVRGYIDRVDVEGDATLVRDLKSGRAYPRRDEEADPTLLRDVQLGLYQLAVKELAGSWRVPRKVLAAYAYASGRGDVEERAFRGDAAALEGATRGWLETAAGLLEARTFPPTPLERDCRFCPFDPVCGCEEQRHAPVPRDGEQGPVARFRSLKLAEKGNDR